MRETTNPSLISPDAVTSIPQLVEDRLDSDPTSTFVERKSGLGTSWTPMSVQAFAEEAAAVAKGLVAYGIEPGDRVSIMSRT
ncbi:MAG TPA: hypothetical protein VEA78_13715, partial [Acidimicrobiales bacterium]|nr:hypothetical protein [Acidimicrobiales bacterium]